MRNFCIVALLDEADELDEALGLVRTRLGQRPIRPPVFLPVVAEEVEAAEALRPQEQSLVGVEAVLQERPVHGLDEGIQAEVGLVVTARDGERHLGQGRAGGRHARLAEEGEGERLASLRGVERAALQPDRMEPVEILVVGAFQIDQERALQAPRRRHVGGVPRIAEAHALVSPALRGHGPARPGELDPEEVPLALPLPRALRPRGRRGASEGGRGRGLHGLVFVRRDLDVEVHDPGQAEEVRAGRLPFASPSSALAETSTAGPARKIAEQVSAVATARTRRRMG